MKGSIMRTTFFFFSLTLLAAESQPTEQSTESPAAMIVEGVLQGLPETATIASEIAAGHNAEAASHIIGCIADDESAVRKVARGSTLCCLRCCKKKKQQ